MPEAAMPRETDIELSAAMTAERAVALCIGACLDQIEQNRERTLASDDPEGPHQLRVGLRKLRSALRLFRPVIGGPAASRLSGTAREIGAAVGRTRDLDVFLTELLPRLSEEIPEAEARAIRDRFEQARARERTELRAMLADDRMRGFLRDLEQFINLRGWLAPEDFAQTERLAEPLGAYAGRSLAARWKKTAKLARHLSGPDAEKRHEFRKDLKKLRYAVDFLAPLYAESAVKPFRKRMKKLQDCVGVLNDIATARTLAEDAARQGADARSLEHLDAAISRLEARSEADRDRAAKLWRALASEPRPWDTGGRKS
jgi:CHAD domain-containing protein